MRKLGQCLAVIGLGFSIACMGILTWDALKTGKKQRKAAEEIEKVAKREQEMISK